MNSLPPPYTILDALAHGVAGRPDKGLRLLQPLVDAGPRSTYALLGALAETAARPAQDLNGPGTRFGIAVDGPDGRPGSTDDLPPALRFATRFITAWGNRDQDTAIALFSVVAEHAETHRTDDLADAIRTVYEIAVVSAQAIVAERRRQRAEAEEDRA